MRTRGPTRVVARVVFAFAVVLCVGVASAFVDDVRALCAADPYCAARWHADELVAFEARYTAVLENTGIAATWEAAYTAPSNTTVAAALVRTLAHHQFCGDAEQFDDALGACVCIPGRDCALNCGKELFLDIKVLWVLVIILFVTVVGFSATILRRLRMWMYATNKRG